MLTPHRGNSRTDVEIRKRQEQVRAGVNPEIALERLGWLFVAKARQTFDPGFYKLAEQCATELDARQPGCAESRLLRGHAWHSQHRFAEAEAIVRLLVAQRGLAFDYGLLGDILVDAGRVHEAAGAYQRMLDLKPDPQGYARAAHIRWLKGDLAGAVEVMRMATRSVSPSDPESAAWMHTQLARYLWQARADDDARRELQMALAFQNGYAPALLWRGRMLLADGKSADAVQSLRQAACANPLPEYHWALADALRVSARGDEARAVESEIIGRGAVTDPRTCSLFLATRGEGQELALRLARRELGERRDIFTHDALAWALAASGRFEEAHARMGLALAEGTEDARLFFHAAVIAVKAGQIEEANRWMTKAAAMKRLLLPDEIEQLDVAAKQIRSSLRSRVSFPSNGSVRLFTAVELRFPMSTNLLPSHEPLIDADFPVGARAGWKTSVTRRSVHGPNAHPILEVDPSHEPPPHPACGHPLPRSERGRGKGEAALVGSGVQCANPPGNSLPTRHERGWSARFSHQFNSSLFPSVAHETTAREN